MLQESVAGQRQQDTGPGQPSPHSTASPQTVTIGAVGIKAAVIRGEVGGQLTGILLLIRDHQYHLCGKKWCSTEECKVQNSKFTSSACYSIWPANADSGWHQGSGTYWWVAYHDFVLVNSLAAPVILGTDFLQQHSLVLDFTRTPVQVRVVQVNAGFQLDRSTAPTHVLQPIFGATHNKRKLYMAAVVVDSMLDVEEERTMPWFKDKNKFEFPECPLPSLETVIQDYEDVFWTMPSITQAAFQYIPITGTTVRVPPCNSSMTLHFMLESNDTLHLQPLPLPLLPLAGNILPPPPPTKKKDIYIYIPYSIPSHPCHATYVLHTWSISLSV